jgi:hypothetical protein
MPITDEVWKCIKTSCNPQPSYNKVLVRLVAQLGNYTLFMKNDGFPRILEGPVAARGNHTTNLLKLSGPNLEYLTMVVERKIAPLLVVELRNIPSFWESDTPSEIILESVINNMYRRCTPRVKWSNPANPQQSIPLLFVDKIPRGVLYLHTTFVYDQFGFRVTPSSYLHTNTSDHTWRGAGGPWIPYEHGAPFNSVDDFDSHVRWNSIYFVADKTKTQEHDSIRKSLLGQSQQNTIRHPAKINIKVIIDILIAIYANNNGSGFQNVIYLVYNHKSMSLSILRLTKLDRT